MVCENINLTEKHASFIRERVESGEYQDASEVVRAGLRLLEDRQADKRAREEQLGAMLDEAEASGLSDRTPREVWAAVKARYQDQNA